MHAPDGADDPLRRRLVREADTFVFLCSGNMVRSAFAELYARHTGFPRPVRSAATTYRNDALFPETARALLELGVPADDVRAFRPTHLDQLAPVIAGAPVFLGMRRHHLDALRAWPRHARRGLLLVPSEEIADPVLEGADFGQTFRSVAAGVDALRRELAADAL